MKKILLLLLFISGLTQAQIVNIPDPNLKSYFVLSGTDTNFNGQIELSEALARTEAIDVGARNISDMTGIQAFVNVEYFWCAQNNMTTLDLSGMTALKNLDVGSNMQLTSINLTGVNNLEYLSLPNTGIVSIEVSNRPFLHTIFAIGSPNLTTIYGENVPSLSGMNLANCIALQHLTLTNNSLTSVWTDITNCPSLQTVNLSSSATYEQLVLQDYPNLVSVDISNSPMLELLWASSENLDNVNLAGLSALTSLSLSGGNFTALDLSDLSALQYLSLSLNENLQSVDLTGLNNLQTAFFPGGSLSSIIFPPSEALLSVYVSGNQIEHLDLSMLPNLVELDCSNNPIVTLNIKNGSNETFLELSNPLNTFQHICADEFQVDTIFAFPAVVSSYCNFVPGGGYNTITGTVRYDANANGCEASDAFVPAFVRMNLTGDTAAANFVGTDGVYHFYTQAGDFTVTPSIQHPEYFTLAPVSADANFPAADGSVATLDFCMAPSGIHPDLEIVMSGSPARPGFDVNYLITYRNNGTTIQSGAIDYTFDDARTNFVSATPAVDAQSINHLIWNFTGLNPFESRTIRFTLHTNSPTDIPALHAGDVLASTAAISSDQTETTPSDNTSTLNQTVVNSYDPNNKICVEGDVVTTAIIGDYLHYNINFENTGTTEAVNVVVKDIIDITRLDLSTLQIVNASHPVRVLVTDNKVEFIFENINLPSAISNPIGGHGNVLFKIKTLPTLHPGDIVTNTANIHFDYNHPIETNEARTTFAMLKRQEFMTDNSVTVYPNPAATLVWVKADSSITSIALFDIQGRILQTVVENKNNATIDISAKQNGIYFLKVTTEKGTKIEKIIKE